MPFQQNKSGSAKQKVKKLCFLFCFAPHCKDCCSVFLLRIKVYFSFNFFAFKITLADLGLIVGRADSLYCRMLPGYLDDGISCIDCESFVLLLQMRYYVLAL